MNPTGKYAPLTSYLQAQQGNLVLLTFSQIEKIIGEKLPLSAYQHEAFWVNNPTRHVHCQAWLEAGFHVESKDVTAKTVTFAR